MDAAAAGAAAGVAANLVASAAVAAATATTAATTAATTTSTTTAAHGVSREDLDSGEVRRESQDVREVECHLLLGGPLYTIFRS